MILITNGEGSDPSQWLIFLDIKCSTMDLVYSGKPAMKTLNKQKQQF